jgi:hypothetical protein
VHTHFTGGITADSAITLTEVRLDTTAGPLTVELREEATSNATYAAVTPRSRNRVGTVNTSSVVCGMVADSATITTDNQIILETAYLAAATTGLKLANWKLEPGHTYLLCMSTGASTAVTAHYSISWTEGA